MFAHLSPDQRFTPAQGRALAASGNVGVASVQGAVRGLAHWAGRSTHSTRAAHAERPTKGTRRGLVASREVLGGMVDAWLAPACVVESAAQAVETAERMGWPVALKAEGSAVEHRTEVGAVRTGLADAAALAEAYEVVAPVCARHGDRVVVQRMSPAGVEVLASVARDAELGPVAVCRPGGELVELACATAVLTAPPGRWRRALLPTPMGQLLAGYRGRPAADVDGLLALLESLVEAVRSRPEILALECNPVVVHPLGRPTGTPAVTIVDLLTSVANP